MDQKKRRTVWKFWTFYWLLFLPTVKGQCPDTFPASIDSSVAGDFSVTDFGSPLDESAVFSSTETVAVETSLFVTHTETQDVEFLLLEIQVESCTAGSSVSAVLTFVGGDMEAIDMTNEGATTDGCTLYTFSGTKENVDSLEIEPSQLPATLRKVIIGGCTKSDDKCSVNNPRPLTAAVADRDFTVTDGGNNASDSLIYSALTYNMITDLTVIPAVQVFEFREFEITVCSLTAQISVTLREAGGSSENIQLTEVPADTGCKNYSYTGVTKSDVNRITLTSDVTPLPVRNLYVFGCGELNNETITDSVADSCPVNRPKALTAANGDTDFTATDGAKDASDSLLHSETSYNVTDSILLLPTDTFQLRKFEMTYCPASAAVTVDVSLEDGGQETLVLKDEGSENNCQNVSYLDLKSGVTRLQVNAAGTEVKNLFVFGCVSPEDRFNSEPIITIPPTTTTTTPTSTKPTTNTPATPTTSPTTTQETFILFTLNFLYTATNTTITPTTTTPTTTNIIPTTTTAAGILLTIISYLNCCYDPRNVITQM